MPSKYLLFLFAIGIALGCTFYGKRNHETNSSNEIELMHSGIYKIFSRESSRCLTFVKNISTFNLVQKECDGSKNQLFRVKEIKEKEYIISLFEPSSFCLSVSITDPTKKILIAKPTCSPKERDIFSFKRSKTDPKFINIRSNSDDKCLDLFEKSRRSGGLLHKYSCTYQSSQDFLFDKINIPKDFSQKIWTYWDSGERKMPAFYQANIKKWRKILETSDFGPWEIKVVNNLPEDPNYFGNFFQVTNIPTTDEIDSHLSLKEKENKLNPKIIVSDFIRLELLYEHGGIWMDPSIILHENFDDVLGVIENISLIELIGYTSKHQASLAFSYADSLENFYMASIKNSDLIKEWQHNFKTYWQQKQPGMDISQHPMFNGSQGPVINLTSFGNLKNYLNQHAALKYTLTKYPEFLNKIYISGDTSSTEKGPFTLLESVNWDDRKLIALNSKYFPDILNTLKNVKMSKFPSENSNYIRFIKGNPKRPRGLDYFADNDNIFGYLNNLDYDDDIVLPNL